MSVSFTGRNQTIFQTVFLYQIPNRFKIHTHSMHHTESHPSKLNTSWKTKSLLNVSLRLNDRCVSYLSHDKPMSVTMNLTSYGMIDWCQVHEVFGALGSLSHGHLWRIRTTLHKKLQIIWHLHSITQTNHKGRFILIQSQILWLINLI